VSTQFLGSGITFMVSTVVCEARMGTFTQVVKDDRLLPESVVFASVTEWKDEGPHSGAARFTVHDVCPGEGKVTIGISHNHTAPLAFQISLWIFGPYILSET